MNDTSGGKKPYLFINYRAQDAGPTASRLYEELTNRLEPEHVFLDHERISGGTSWPDSLRVEAKAATVMFVLIGKRWLMEQDPETGDRRLNQPDDWVRQEIELGFEHGLHVVPILVEGTPPLDGRSLETLPSIAPLVLKQAVPLRRKEWKTDCDRLVEMLATWGFPTRRADESSAAPEAPTHRASERSLEIEKQLSQFYRPIHSRLRRDNVIWRRILDIRKGKESIERKIAVSIERDFIFPNHDEIVKVIEDWRHLVEPDPELSPILDRYIRHVFVYKALRATGDEERFPIDVGEVWPRDFFPLIEKRIESLEEEQRALR